MEIKWFMILTKTLWKEFTKIHYTLYWSSYTVLYRYIWLHVSNKRMGTFHNCANSIQKYILALILTTKIHIRKGLIQVCLSFDNPISFKLQISDDIHICWVSNKLYSFSAILSHLFSLKQKSCSLLPIISS